MTTEENYGPRLVGLEDVHFAQTEGDESECGYDIGRADGVYLETTHRGPSRRRSVTCLHCLHAEIDRLVGLLARTGGAGAVQLAGYSPEEYAL